MSYCRRFQPDSDLYVWEDMDGTIWCDVCPLGGDFTTKSPRAMANHLRYHIAVGHAVPDSALRHFLIAGFLE